MSADLLPARDRREKTSEWYERQKSRERIKLVGLVMVAAVILLIGFVRFGKTIPWGAR